MKSETIPALAFEKSEEMENSEVFVEINNLADQQHLYNSIEKTIVVYIFNQNIPIVCC